MRILNVVLTHFGDNILIQYGILNHLRSVIEEASRIAIFSGKDEYVAV